MDDAVAAHISQGGQLAPEASMAYGTDPMAEYPSLQTLRDRDYRLTFPSTELFEDILHNDGALFQQAVLSFIDINHRYLTLIP